MSTFDALESSLDSSRPLEIYSITIGSETFRYTSAEDDITIGSDIYTTISISRSKISHGADAQNNTVTVTLPGNNVFAAKYRNIVPGNKATVNIWRLQRDETPSLVPQLIFKGQVMSVRFPQDGNTADIAVRSIEQALNRNIPRFTYMGSCNHVLYDQRCKVDPTLFDVIGTVSAVSATVITLPGANAQPDGFYTGGYCTPTVGNQDFRMILDHTGNDLTLLLPFAADVTGLTVQAFAGCDHVVFGDCATKFDNVIEFGGFAFVPNKNVFQEGLE